MADSLALPLRPPSINNAEKHSLQSRIFQIYSQKGAFRHVTEASLIEDIKSQKRHDEDTAMADAEDADAAAEIEQAEQSERQQTIGKSREGMMQQLRRAQNDTLMTLDFISLLLSKFAPTTAESTMSPALKAAVPIGTLEARLMKHTPLTIAESSSNQTVSRAYKLQGFSDAAHKLLGAATRLQDEAAKESRYWEEVMSIKKEGWPISKMPREPHTLAVHFGFRDAAPFYRSRGSAALRRNPDGRLRLDHGAIRPRPVALQLSVIRNGRCCGHSSISSRTAAVGAASTDEQILQARNTLFEKELFHELGREARLLANQGATMSLEQIRAPMGKDAELHLDLVNLDDSDSARDGSGADHQLAEGISIALRMLLCHAHEQKLRRRSQPPPPLTLEPRSNPEYLLLRPVLTHIRHQNNLETVKSYLTSLTGPLTAAGLSARFEIAESSFSHPLLYPSSSPTKNRLADPTSVLESLITPLTTALTVHLPTSRTQTLNLHTNLNPPLFGTEYTFHPSIQTYPSTTLSLPRLTSSEELERQLRHILTVDLVALIDSPRDTSTFPSLSSQPQESKRKKKSAAYHIQDPHTGSLFLLLQSHSEALQQQQQQQQQQEKQEKQKKIQISLRLQPGRLGMRSIGPTQNATATSASEGNDRDGAGARTTTTTTTYMWTSDGGTADDKMWTKVGRNVAVERQAVGLGHHAELASSGLLDVLDGIGGE